MYCSKCGAENIENASFCQECGKKLEFTSNPQLNGLCFNAGCLNLEYMEIGSNCPDCGSLIAKDDSKSKKIRSKKKKKSEDLIILEDKKKEYGFLKVAKGVLGRLELYDYRIRLGKKDYLIEDIVSIDFKGISPKSHGYGHIKFNIRGMNTKGGTIATFGASGLNIGGYGRNTSQTKMMFKEEWENEFREIKNIIESKLIQYHSNRL